MATERETEEDVRCAEFMVHRSVVLVSKWAVGGKKGEPEFTRGKIKMCSILQGN